MTDTLARVPPHLRRYVVEQNYTEYTALDQAVWRFVLLQMYDKLQHTAHKAYSRGLAATGISVERIPSLQEMDRCLSRHGWGAVGVDGFIPPRAFTEFQAAGILPICAEIRSADHLVYTPAPDIIHEAAGHAPIIVDAKYSNYLKEIGEVGARAFTLPADDQVYRAIYTLSEVKERPGATREEVAAAERALEQACALASEVSEATRVSRLYWWTAEYGLVGTPQNFELYGAGLLSSLGESHSCQRSQVAKLPLSAACTEVGYDITKAQPQLFVAEDFDQLTSVLQTLASSLAFQRGGRLALERAWHSQELCTLTLDTGLQVIGRVAELCGEATKGVLIARVNGRIALAERGKLLAEDPLAAEPHELWLLIGSAGDGSRLGSHERWARAAEQHLSVELEQDLKLECRVARRHQLASGLLVLAEDFHLLQGGTTLARCQYAWLLCSSELMGARAGASDPAYHPQTDFGSATAPLPRKYPSREKALIGLYRQALHAHFEFPTQSLVESFAEIHHRLETEFPHDWLLRWNLLESLRKRGERGLLARTLADELRALEYHYSEQEPILSGLKYLGYG